MDKRFIKSSYLRVQNDYKIKDVPPYVITVLLDDGEASEELMQSIMKYKMEILWTLRNTEDAKPGPVFLDIVIVTDLDEKAYATMLSDYATAESEMTFPSVYATTMDVYGLIDTGSKITDIPLNDPETLIRGIEILSSRLANDAAIKYKLSRKEVWWPHDEKLVQQETDVVVARNNQEAIVAEIEDVDKPKTIEMLMYDIAQKRAGVTSENMLAEKFAIAVEMSDKEEATRIIMNENWKKWQKNALLESIDTTTPEGEALMRTVVVHMEKTTLQKKRVMEKRLYDLTAEIQSLKGRKVSVDQQKELARKAKELGHWYRLTGTQWNPSLRDIASTGINIAQGGNIDVLRYFRTLLEQRLGKESKGVKLIKGFSKVLEKNAVTQMLSFKLSLLDFSETLKPFVMVPLKPYASGFNKDVVAPVKAALAATTPWTAEAELAATAARKACDLAQKACTNIKDDVLVDLFGKKNIENIFEKLKKRGSPINQIKFAGNYTEQFFYCAKIFSDVKTVQPYINSVLSCIPLNAYMPQWLITSVEYILSLAIVSSNFGPLRLIVDSFSAIDSATSLSNGVFCFVLSSSCNVIGAMAGYEKKQLDIVNKWLSDKIGSVLKYSNYALKGLVFTTVLHMSAVAFEWSTVQSFTTMMLPLIEYSGILTVLTQGATILTYIPGYSMAASATAAATSALTTASSAAINALPALSLGSAVGAAAAVGAVGYLGYKGYKYMQDRKKQLLLAGGSMVLPAGWREEGEWFVHASGRFQQRLPVGTRFYDAEGTPALQEFWASSNSAPRVTVKSSGKAVHKALRGLLEGGGSHAAVEKSLRGMPESGNLSIAEMCYMEACIVSALGGEEAYRRRRLSNPSPKAHLAAIEMAIGYNGDDTLDTITPTKTRRLFRRLGRCMYHNPLLLLARS